MVTDRAEAGAQPGAFSNERVSVGRYNYINARRDSLGPHPALAHLSRYPGLLCGGVEPVILFAGRGGRQYPDYIVATPQAEFQRLSA